MVLPGHLAGGYLATRAVLELSGVSFSSAEMIALTIVGTLAGELPDIDLAWFYYQFQIKKNRAVENHRNYITHTPVLWLLICALISAIGLLVGSQFIQILGLVILAGSFSHLILDTIEGGVRWLWPYSNTSFYGVESVAPETTDDKGKFSYYWRYITKTYVKRFSFYLEIIITILALILAYKQISG